MKRFIAFSGGVESTTMCILFGKDAQPIFTDTKFEHDLVYKQIARVEEIGKELHGPDFTVLHITAKDVEGTGTDSLVDYIRHRRYYPNPAARFCTRLFKIEPMDDFLATQGECEILIGLNFDEAEDREGNYGACKNVRYAYPLIEAGYTRPMCEALLEAHDLHPHYPAYMSRGGCKGCFFKGKREYEAMALLAPEEAYSIADLEDSIQDRREKHFSIHSSIPNMRTFIDQVRQANLFPPNEIYSKAPDAKGCGVFCHR